MVLTKRIAKSYTANIRFKSAKQDTIYSAAKTKGRNSICLSK